MPFSARREQEVTVSESAWLTSTDPQAMLAFLRDRGPVSERKVRLFAVACCHRLRDLLREDVLHFAVGVLEEGRVHSLGDSEYEVLRDQLERAVYAIPPAGDPMATARSVAALAVSSAFHSFGQYQPVAHFVVQAQVAAGRNQVAEVALQAALLRDIVGNPFRPVPFSPGWRTEAAVALARGIYEERAFERMPVLADALEDAGCDSAEVLEHCRGDEPHVRGCWGVDAVLGKG
jgi:hypothetical protein